MNLTSDECYNLIANSPRRRTRDNLLLYDIYFHESFLSIVPCLLNRDGEDYKIADNHCNLAEIAKKRMQWPYLGQGYLSFAFRKDKNCLNNFAKKASPHIVNIVPGLAPEFLRELYFEEGRKNFLTATLGFPFLQEIKKMGTWIKLDYHLDKNSGPVVYLFVYDKTKKNPFNKENVLLGSLEINLYQENIKPSDTELLKDIYSEEVIRNEILRFISRNTP